MSTVSEVIKTEIARQAIQHTLFEHNNDVTRAQFKVCAQEIFDYLKKQRAVYDNFTRCDWTNNPPIAVVSNKFIADIFWREDYFETPRHLQLVVNDKDICWVEYELTWEGTEKVKS